MGKAGRAVRDCRTSAPEPGALPASRWRWEQSAPDEPSQPQWRSIPHSYAVERSLHFALLCGPDTHCLASRRECLEAHSGRSRKTLTAPVSAGPGRFPPRTSLPKFRYAMGSIYFKGGWIHRPLGGRIRSQRRSNRPVQRLNLRQNVLWQIRVRLQGGDNSYTALGAGGPPGHGGPEWLLGKRLPYCAAADCSNRSIALAKPSSSFEAVTNVADFCTSGLALPIAMLTPLFLNIRTSFGMSPMVAIWLGGMLQSCENIPTTSPLFALGFVTSR